MNLSKLKEVGNYCTRCETPVRAGFKLCLCEMLRMTNAGIARYHAKYWRKAYIIIETSMEKANGK